VLFATKSKSLGSVFQPEGLAWHAYTPVALAVTQALKDKMYDTTVTMEERISAEN